VLNSCIEVSDYNEQYSLCQPLLPSPESTVGLTRAQLSGNPPPLHMYTIKCTCRASSASLFWNGVNSSKIVGLSTSVSEATDSLRAHYREEEVCQSHRGALVTFV
jgi:hypothetical protein